MSVLVDTSVWVGHFKQHDARLASLLEAGLVLCHPYVVVEVACGTPPQRQEVLRLLQRLESLPVATPAELLHLVQQRGLYGRGCGFVDIALLASVLLRPDARLWTLDERLEAVCAELGRAHGPAPPP